MPAQGLDPNYQSPDEGKLPPELQASIERHRQHLAALVASLRAAGLPEGMIDASVRQLVDSYGVELSAALRKLRKDMPHG
jgi:hypothetical protein